MRESDESTNPVALVAALPQVRALAAALRDSAHLVAQGAQGGSTHMVAGAIAQLTRAPVLLVVAHVDDADDAADALTSLGVTASVFPALELTRAGETVAPEALAQRLRVAEQSLAGAHHELTADSTAFPAPGSVLVAPIQALMQTLPSRDSMPAVTRQLRLHDSMSLTDLVRWLESAGYSREDAIEEPGDFAVRGGIVDIFAPAALAQTMGDGASAQVAAIRLDFFGDEIDAIHEIDIDTMGVDQALAGVRLVTCDAAALDDSGAGSPLLAWTPDNIIAITDETLEVTQQGRGYFERAKGGGPVIGPPRVFQLLRERCAAVVEINQFTPARGVAGDAHALSLPFAPLHAFAPDAAHAVGELLDLAAEARVVALCQTKAEQTRLRELLREADRAQRDANGGAAPRIVTSRVAYAHHGFTITGDTDSSAPLVSSAVHIVPYHELLHRYQPRRTGAARSHAGRARDAFIEMAVGDYVVHADHGLAMFVGLETGKAKRFAALWDESDDAGLEERLVLEFAQGVRIHAPVEQIDKVQKYIGSFRGKPALSTVGGKRWSQQKGKVKDAVRDLAMEMLRVQALREHAPGVAYPDDTAWQREFEAAFPYVETDDQIAAMGEIKKDMRATRPMDRLLCGDVGFGKTELAIRAAFKAIEFGRQVAIVVPTTVLAEQHERVFRERLADFPFRVEAISRLKGASAQRDVIKALAKGEIDIVIGTHRLLSKDVKFADLGLLIVDEEQRFGVEHKQRLLEQRATVDVLTLSATPIPRTLHMSLLGLRDISSLATAPLDRRAVITEVVPWNNERIKQAINRELARDGQVFFVHNRVRSIKRIAQVVRDLAPDARVVVAHGQMPPKELERVMLAFVRRKADILVCTTIIESGVDIATANTIIITDADRFGLADLHQLRGRVGRHKHRAYCSLLLPEDRVVTEKAKKRLRAIEQFNMLGAGFRIAMRDLEIRGAGNLLGAEQSGHIAAVGYDMYCRLLESCVRELTHDDTPHPIETTIALGLVGRLPNAYIPADSRRLAIYRRLSQARAVAEIDTVHTDMRSAYGEPPAAARRLLDLARIRVSAAHLGAASVKRVGRDIVFETATPGLIVAALGSANGAVRALLPRKPGALHDVYLRPEIEVRNAAALVQLLVEALGQDRAPLTQAQQDGAITTGSCSSRC